MDVVVHASREELSLFRPLLPDWVAVAEGDPASADERELHPAERASIAGAVEKRRREFTAGRLLARRLLGERAFPLLKDANGVPRWPDGVRGSITHCDRFAAVAVGDAGRLAGLGIDVEPAEPLPGGVAALVITPRESLWLAVLTPAERGVAQRIIFSAKEAIYKAQHARSGAFVNFTDVDVEMDLEGGAFRGVLLIEAPAYSRGTVFHGRHRVAHGLIATAVVIEAAR